MQLAVVVDVDSLCDALNGRIERGLVGALRMFGRSKARVVLVSSGAHELAASILVDLEPASCEHAARPGEPFASVLAEIRDRVRDTRVVAVSSDQCLWNVLGHHDRFILVRAPAAELEASAATAQVIDAMWVTLQSWREQSSRTVRRSKRSS